jgi:hypothetical protein
MSSASDRGRIGIFYNPKKSLGGKNDPPIRFIHLIIALKVFKICKQIFALITKVNEGESNAYTLP